MITNEALNEAILELQGTRNPNAGTAIKLASLLTIKKEMYGGGYSYAPAPAETPTETIRGTEVVGEYGDSDFLIAVSKMKPADAWAVVDEIMDTLKMVNPRVYDGIMRKLKP